MNGLGAFEIMVGKLFRERVYWVLLSCWCAAIAGLAQKLPFNNYSIDEGLLQSSVFAMIQDRDGYLWFGTTAGASRFDGHSFTNYSREFALADPVIRAMALDHEGSLWFGTGSGATRYDGHSFTNFNQSNGLPGNEIRAIMAASDSSLWFGSFGYGAARLKDGEWTYFTFDGERPSVTALVEDKDGSVWFGVNSGLWRYHDGEVTRVDLPALKDRLISALSFDHEGRLWIGVQRSGDLPYGAARWRPGQELDWVVSSVTVNTLYRDRRGYMWITTRDSGAYRVEGDNVRNYSRDTGLPNNSINAVWRDHEGSMWFGAYGGGVSRLSNENFLNYTQQDGFREPSAYCFVEDREGGLWIGTNGGGASRLKDNRFTAFTREDGLAHNKVLSATLDRRGRLWLGALEGLSIRDQGVFKSLGLEDGLSSDKIFDLQEDRNGAMWVATLNGLSRIVDDRVRPFADGVPGAGLRFNKIVERANGEMWFAGKGLLIYDGETFKTFDFPDDWRDPYINDMIEDRQQRIWIAMSGGLVCIENGSLRKFTEEEGLNSNLCKTVIEDRNGAIWVGTIRGLNRLVNGSFDSFTSKEGIISNEIMRGASYRDAQGNIWFGANQGVTIFTYNAEVKLNTTPPPVHLTEFRVMDEQVTLSESSTFAYNRNSVEFDFTGITFSAPELMTYDYMLDGLDDEWSTAKQSTIQYASLPPGDYVFRVRAINGDGVGSRRPAELAFSIEPPFWQRAWFIAVAAVVVLVIVWFVFRSQVRKERLRAEAMAAIEANKAKSAFLAHMSHELRTPLNAILGYSEILEEDFEYNQDKVYLEDIHKVQFSAHHLLSLINNILDISKMDAGKMTVFIEDFGVGEMVEMVKNTVMPMVRKNQNDFVVSVGDVSTVRADKAKLRQILLNLISNAAKFTQDGRITLSIQPEQDGSGDDWVVFSVIDTGIGMNEDERAKLFAAYTQTGEALTGKFGGTGLGLMISKRFCEMMNAHLDVISTPGEGSIFTVRLPAPKQAPLTLSTS